MKTNKLFLITSLYSITLLIGGCTTCPMHYPMHPEQQHKEMQHKKHKEFKEHKRAHKSSEPIVFYQNYNNDSEISNVKANIYTRSSQGGESEMGTIKFKETDEGLKMSVDLVDLRPGKTYTTKVYQCFGCNDSTCCNTSPMNIDLPKIKIQNAGRLQESYIIRGLTATQLSNAKIVLTRDGGYKAAWGVLLNQ